jgi:FolB domain-containing protein
LSNENSKPVNAVAALVQNQAGELLFLKAPKWGGRWALPAGKVEYGEPLADAIRREIREETHLEVDQLQSLIVQELLEPEDFHVPAHFISHAFLAHAVSEEVIRNDESVDHCWKSPADALELSLNSPTRELLEHPQVRKALLQNSANVKDAAMGQVIVDQLEFDCIIGILPEERVTPQPLRLSIQLETCFRQARETEDVSHTVDYFQLAQEAKALCQKNEYQLIETLVEDVAEMCLRDERVNSTRVRAEKPQAIPGANCSAVEIFREQKSN